MQCVGLGVVHDTADVVAKPEDFLRPEGLRVDPVDDGGAVRTVLGDRNPEPAAVVVDAAWMVDVPLAQRDTLDQSAIGPHLEQVANSFPGGPVIAALGLLEPMRGRDDFDRRDEELVADLDHALRMVRDEADLHLVHLDPLR